MTKQRGLNRGVRAVLNGLEKNSIRKIPLKYIKPNPFQPRKHFDKKEINDLMESIKEKGVIQPIIVREKNKYYEIIAGERRFRASKLAKLTEIPAIVKNISDEEMLEIAIIENVQREDLNPVDEAMGYRELSEKFKLTHEQIAKKVGKSRAHITNIMRILDLETKIKNLIIENKISLGHAKVLLSIKDKHRRISLAEHIAQAGISVRDLEKIIKTTKSTPRVHKKKKEDTHIKYIIEELSQILNRKIEIKYKKGKGKISLEFYNNDDFNNLLKILGLKNID